MAERQLYNQEFNSVAMPRGRMEEAQAVAGAVQKVGIGLIQMQEKQDEMKMVKYGSQAEQEMIKKSEEIRIKYMDNPTSPQAQQEFSKEYDRIYGEYDNKFSRFSVGKWKALRDSNKQQLEIANTKWAIAQNIKNAQTNLNSGIATALDTSYGLGMTGDIEGALTSAESKELQLREAVKGILPESKINQDMKNFKSDYMKNFVLGLAEKDPDQAFTLLEDEKVKKILGNEDTYKTLNKIISVNKQKAEIGLYRSQLSNSFDFEEKEATLNLGQKLTELERGLTDGRYDPKWAKSKRDLLLKSDEGKTNAEEMTNFIETIYSLPAQNEELGDSKEFINNIAELRESITASPNLSEKDRKRLNEELLRVVKAPQAKALVEISGEGYYVEAKRVFERTLPLEKRSSAMVEYFRATQGEEISVEKQQELLNKIVSGIQNKEREVAKNLMNKATEKKEYAEGDQIEKNGVVYTYKGNGNWEY